MDYEVVWTERAISDLEAAIHSIAIEVPLSAERLRLDLLESVAFLSRFPSIGPIYERLRARRVREYLCNRYRIFYQIDEQILRIEILMIWHSSRKEPRIFGRN